MTDVLGDVRGLLYTGTIGIGVGIAFVENETVAKRIFLNTASFMVVYSAFAVLVELIFALDFFSIRTGAAVLYTSGGQAAQAAAVRLVPISGLSCVVIAGVLLGLWLSKRVTTTSYPLLWPVVGSGLFIGFQGFSRNNLIALFIIVGVCVVLNLGVTPILRLVAFVSAFAAFLVVLWVFLGEYSAKLRTLGEQSLESFRERVLSGLNPDTVAEDYSSQWRVTESAAGLKSISENPLGTGLGVPYRGWLPGEPFTSDYGFTYLHNSYLWFPVKAGLLSSLIILIIVLLMIVASFKNRNGLDRGLFSVIASTGAGLAVVMAVSPLPFSRGDGVLCGTALGLYFWSLCQATPERIESTKRLAPLGSRCAQ
ncbi:hypothetical protein J2M53_12975 [Arthrobacter sp. zg-ZUI100]|uniref:hypothetical protein n=1 Tax=Arthrobacter jiangjiafuii TaxID=2817475 RepID=UPI001AED441F|nr:hypothetical protein [Arthrobacter jiangjiafuii]MBP3037157.1 hypothetical protein [Arthrobacter jiangjiafuii]